MLDATNKKDELTSDRETTSPTKAKHFMLGMDRFLLVPPYLG